MSYTFTVNTGDGTTTIFPFSFAGQDEGYLSVSNVQVFVAGTAVPFTIPTNDPNKVYLTSAPPVGAEVLIRRIMPKNVPYSDFSRGNPFSQDTLNDTNLQMLYVIQEILDGFLPDGFYLKGDLNMGGHKIVNMAPGSQDGDATNWEQLQEQVVRNDEQDQRLEAIESSLVANVGTRTVPYYYIATGGEVRWQLPLPFQSALLFINGVFQNQNLGAFTISNNGFDLAEPLVQGDEVYALLGSSAAAPDDYVKYAELALKEGADLIGYGLNTTHTEGTIGKKLSYLLTPYDFGAIADGTLHPLSERFSTLSDAQLVYPFVTSLTQSIDYAAIQACVNEMITRGASGMSMGGRGRYCINDMVLVNKTASINEANKFMDFSGAEVMTFGGHVILNDKSFTTWSLNGGVSVSSSNIVFNGDTVTQASASVSLFGLTIGKRYSVSFTCDEYTSTGYLRARLDGIAISNINESGPGTRYAEFTATATTHLFELRDDTYSVTPTLCRVNEVDVRELNYAFDFYQGGSAITHGSLIVNNLRIVDKGASTFGGIRCEDLNHSKFQGITAIDGFYGPALHMLNMTIWSENNTFDEIKAANCREVVRLNRVFRNGNTTGLNSFARNHFPRIIMSGVRYGVVVGVSCSLYDSEIGTISGNLTPSFRAIFSLHGDQTDTRADSVRVESNSAPSSSGIFEYGRNDLRRLYLGNVGTYTGVKLLADGSWASGVVTEENTFSNHDFRPSNPSFSMLNFKERSGTLGTGLTYNAGTVMWAETLTNCQPGTPYTLGTAKGLVVRHGIVDIDAALRLSDGTGYQGTKYCIKMIKATVFTANSSKVVVMENKQVIASEDFTTSWSADTNPALSFSGTENRGIQVFVRWTL